MMEEPVKKYTITGNQVIQTNMHHPLPTFVIMHILILIQVKVGIIIIHRLKVIGTL